ncbi:hypothetical protein C2W64_03818 [Brevibacillus laterosporus]|nr:hypothetical protein C2W64_03818 [Brevibacillus laterosporus]
MLEWSCLLVAVRLKYKNPFFYTYAEGRLYHAGNLKKGEVDFKT